MDVEVQVTDPDPLLRTREHVLSPEAKNVELVKEVLGAAFVPLDDPDEIVLRATLRRANALLQAAFECSAGKRGGVVLGVELFTLCLLYTSPSPRD